MAPKYFEVIPEKAKDCVMRYLSKVCGAAGNRIRSKYGQELGAVKDFYKVRVLLDVMRHGYESDVSRITVEPIDQALPQHVGPVDRKAYKAITRFLLRRCNIKEESQVEKLECAVLKFLKIEASKLEQFATG
ncbi:hypothetical protein KY336_04585 [Candidatus Woesearchaeota archaeon]|nr:hypothetical protein [Candidatus Woesearchaeota archaeon]